MARAALAEGSADHAAAARDRGEALELAVALDLPLIRRELEAVLGRGSRIKPWLS
jgi:hypothetical protein